MNNPTQHRNWILGIRGRVAGALASAIMLAVAAVAAPSAQAQNLTSFDASGAGTGKNQGTLPISINTAGDITGFYRAASNLNHGFVRAANGTITTVDVPGAKETEPFSINTAGAIAGTYKEASTLSHGFLRAANGTIKTIDVPGAIGTALSGINAAEDITGFYKDASYVYHGFVRAANGTITYPIDAPDAGAGTWEGTEPISINTAGDIAGYCIDASYVYHGFVRAANGTINTFDAPGASTGPGTLHGGVGTTPVSINTAGDIAGTYTDAGGARHGFVRAANGTITSFDAPGAVTGAGVIQGTGGSSINAAGDITGAYADASALLHGFVRAANGTISTFSAPGAGKGPGIVQGTGGISINTAGAVTGVYTDASGVFHGFVLGPATATTTTLSSSPNPSTYGQAVTFTAEVTSKAGAPPDGETVSFMKGTTVLGTGALSGGSASFTTSTLKVGTNSIKAVYGGDSNFAGSTSKAVSQVVDKATTTTTLASSQNPSNFGQSVTFTATVAPQSSGTPTGTVTFNNGSTKLETVPLSGGVAHYTTTKLAVGTETIKAVYNGSTSFTTSTSNALSQAVNQANTTTTLVSSLNPSTYKQAVTFTATVSPQFSGTVTGTVAFYDGATLLKTVTLSGDKAKFTTSKLTSGPHSITATYNGSTDFTGSSSAPLPQTVN